MHATRRIDIELRVREALRVLRTTGKIEDAGLELKGSPPAPEAKAAQLAGAANASGGESIVWVFGIAEDGTFVDITGFEFDEWFAKMPSQFDGPYPEPTIAWIEHDGNGILAASFRTDHAPYVVKRASDPRQRETPWREGSHTRTATRSELVRMILPQARLPRIEVLGGGIVFEPQPGQHPDLLKDMSFSVALFIESVDTVGFHLSQHRCVVTMRLGDHIFTASAGTVSLQATEHAQYPQTAGVRPTSAGLYVQDAGSFAIHTKRVGPLPENVLRGVREAQVTLSLGFGPPIGRIDAVVTTGSIGGNRMPIVPGTSLILVRR
ncbi:MAG: hypothetical protein JSR16_12355 [Proteobacteria bacterium]|nr:hypothetical protein [Pseudomonadota bacterium]